jgi:hypothetical protein
MHVCVCVCVCVCVRARARTHLQHLDKENKTVLYLVHGHFEDLVIVNRCLY